MLFSQIRRLLEEFQSLTNSMLSERGLSELVAPSDVNRVFKRYETRFEEYIEDPLWPAFKFPLTANEQTTLTNKLKLRFTQLDLLFEEMSLKVKYGGSSPALKDKTVHGIILVLVLCFSMAGLTVRTPSQTRNSDHSAESSDVERPPDTTEQEGKSQIDKSRSQRKLELDQTRKEQKKATVERGRQAKSGRAQRELEIEQMRKQGEKLNEEAGGFIFAKYALRATEEQWKLIKPKLEKVRQLREQADSRVGASLAGGPSETAANPRTGARPSVPTWQWKNPWKDKVPGELTEAQKLAKQLIALVESKDVAPGTLRRTMDALRKARGEEAEIERRLAEARRELREILTTRQEAALVLMNSL